MSTIVVVRKGARACIAADTLTSFGDVKQSSAYALSHDKIFEHAGNYVGLVGSAAHDAVVRSLLADAGEEYDFRSRMAIFESFRRIHPLLKEHYYLNPKEDDDTPYESSRIDALIANRHGVFSVFSLREVFEYSRFWAIGAGSDFALGAMFGVYDRCDDACEIARVGVAAATEFDNASALPMTLYPVDLAPDPALDPAPAPRARRKKKAPPRKRRAG